MGLAHEVGQSDLDRLKLAQASEETQILQPTTLSTQNPMRSCSHNSDATISGPLKRNLHKCMERETNS